jgi:hypothetical protein
MLFHLPIVILTSLHPIPVADSVPKFDVVRECQFEGGTKEEQDRCTTDETQALKQLQTEWAQFSASQKRQCDEEATTGNIPSYVELLTCLEMERDVRR